MSDHKLRVVRRGFTYPDAASMAIVREAGGVSKLTQEQREQVTFRRVEVGEDCSDMPADSVAAYLDRGDIERVDASAEWIDLGRPEGTN